jgi:hypothetical protein
MKKNKTWMMNLHPMKGLKIHLMELMPSWILQGVCQQLHHPQIIKNQELPVQQQKIVKTPMMILHQPHQTWQTWSLMTKVWHREELIQCIALHRIEESWHGGGM